MNNKHNNLALFFPSLAAEWHPTKNGPLQASDFLPGSNQYAWWQCRYGHEWKAKINNRTQTQSQCPYCAGKLPIKGVNDLKTCYPHIAAEWHPTKNGNLTPADVLPHSNKMVTWICEKQHEWITKVYHRTDGTTCPYCAGQRPIKGKTDLQSLYPYLSNEWHPSKNGSDQANNYTPWSHQRVWWICANGHEWQAAIMHRTNGQGCPVCSGRRVVAGFNDLATSAPWLANEWAIDKNGSLQPTQVTLHSNKTVWWQCSNGHQWQARINNRANGTGCPFCNQARLIPEKTSLAAINPALATQWDAEKNSPLTPRDVTAYCNDAHWWRCEKGHSWKAAVSNRQLGKGCPYCSGHLAISGENDLATVAPHIALQWNIPKNGLKKPNQYLPLSNKKVWWICEKGHEWQAAIYTRTLGACCPYCKGNLPIAGENDFATMCPDVAKQWNSARNGDKKPHQYLPFSAQKVWWICENGHEWQAAIGSRSNGTGCPHCLKRRSKQRKFL